MRKAGLIRIRIFFFRFAGKTQRLRRTTRIVYGVLRRSEYFGSPSPSAHLEPSSCAGCFRNRLLGGIVLLPALNQRTERQRAKLRRISHALMSGSSGINLVISPENIAQPSSHSWTGVRLVDGMHRLPYGLVDLEVPENIRKQIGHSRRAPSMTTGLLKHRKSRFLIGARELVSS